MSQLGGTHERQTLALLDRLDGNPKEAAHFARMDPDETAVARKLASRAILSARDVS